MASNDMMTSDGPSASLDAVCTCSGVATVGAERTCGQCDATVPYRPSDEAERLAHVWNSLALNERRSVVRLAELMTRSRTVRSALLAALTEELGE